MNHTKHENEDKPREIGMSLPRRNVVKSPLKKTRFIIYKNVANKNKKENHRLFMGQCK
jgi:hypothetical protein